MKIIDLFSGIGGFSLAGHWAGWETALFCEISKFPQKVLQKNFPGIYIHEDVKTLNGDLIKQILTKKYGYFDANELILTGGFPCQPFSQAGLRKGAEDERALFPYILDILQEVRPKWAVLENVYGIINIQNGQYFEQEVCAQLEGIGYTVQPYIIPASAVGAWHNRNRVWFIAHSNEIQQRTLDKCQGENLQQFKTGIGCKSWSDLELVADGTILKGWRATESGSSTLPFVRRKSDGLSNWLDRFGALGNAIVPQVAFLLFQVINEIEAMYE